MRQIDVIMFATKNLEVYTELSIATWQKYCDIHGYRFFHYEKPYYNNLHLAWSKIKCVQEHLSASKAPYVLLVDADTIPTSFDVEVTALIDKFMTGEKQILFQKDGSDWLFETIYFPHNLYNSIVHSQRVQPNAGFILMKNTPEVKSFYREWTDRAHTSPWASKPPRNQNVLIHEMLIQKKINQLVGYFDTWVINKYKGKLCQHFSSKGPQEVRELMIPYYIKLMEPKIGVILVNNNNSKHLQENIIPKLLSSKLIGSITVLQTQENNHFNYPDVRVTSLKKWDNYDKNDLGLKFDIAKKVKEPFTLIQDGDILLSENGIAQLLHNAMLEPNNIHSIPEKSGLISKKLNKDTSVVALKCIIFSSISADSANTNMESEQIESELRNSSIVHNIKFKQL